MHRNQSAPFDGRLSASRTSQPAAWVGVFLILALCQLDCGTVFAQPTTPCDCGPDFCLNDPRYPGKLAAKKAALTKAGYPADLVALMDRGSACVAQIERAPHGFSIMTVGTSGELLVRQWTSELENSSREQLVSGSIKAYYKFKTRLAFQCCKEKRPEERADWDEKLGMNTNLAISCTLESGKIVCR